MPVTCSDRQNDTISGITSLRDQTKDLYEN